jgi:hypothetical protein
VDAQVILMQDNFDAGTISTGPGEPWSDTSDLYPAIASGLRASNDDSKYGAIVGVGDYGAAGDAEWLWPCSSWSHMEHYLITNPVDCTGLDSITVHYDLKYYVPWAVDHYYVKYRLSDTASWIILKEYSDYWDQYFIDEVLSIPDAVNEPFLQVAFEFFASTDCSSSATWYVLDEVSIEAAGSVTPPPSRTPTSTITSGATPTPTPTLKIPVSGKTGHVIMIISLIVMTGGLIKKRLMQNQHY